MSATSKAQSKAKRSHGPVAPTRPPVGIPGEACTIVFGHNVEIGKVLMRFGLAAEQLVFTPAEARDVASKLSFYADMADGTRTQ